MSKYSSVLFACDHNAIRSPMAEGLMKKNLGQKIYVQSAGVVNDMEIDGFAIAVCQEIGVELDQHRVRNFEELENWGEAIDGFDLIVALSPASHAQAKKLIAPYSVDLTFWDIQDPTSIGRSREEKAESYRATRDQILSKIRENFL